MRDNNCGDDDQKDLEQPRENVLRNFFEATRMYLFALPTLSPTKGADRSS